MIGEDRANHSPLSLRHQLKLGQLQAVALLEDMSLRFKARKAFLYPQYCFFPFTGDQGFPVKEPTQKA